MVTARRFVNALAIALVALALAACGSTTLTRMAYANAAFAYTNLGPMLSWMVDEYLDLTGTQEDWVRERVGRLMEWHRAQELPKYRRFLESALAKAEAPFTAQDVASHQRAIRAHYLRVVEQAIPDMAELLAGLDAEQVAQLERKFAEDNRKFARESTRGTPEQRRERRMRRFTDQLEVWVGPLGDGQREIVAAFYRDAPDFSDEMLGERRFRQTEILALLKAKTPKEAMAPQLRRLFVDMDSWRRPEYAEKLRARDQKGFEMLAALSESLTAQQRAALQKRIRNFLRDIGTLSSPA